MSITVKKLSKKFELLKPAELKKLTGKTHYKPEDIIPLGNIAAYHDKEIKVYAAQVEGNPFIELLQEKTQREIATAAGIKTTSDKNNVTPIFNANRTDNINNTFNLFNNNSYTSNNQVYMPKGSIFTNYKKSID